MVFYLKHIVTNKLFMILTLYLRFIHSDNPLGMKGNIAKDYGELVRDIWKGRSRTIAPLRLRVNSISYYCGINITYLTSLFVAVDHWKICSEVQRISAT